jgi:ArsR family transcriptional regulator
MKAQYFKALADSTRIRLLNLLLKHELNVNEITTIFNMGQSRVSRHLKILTDAGLLLSRKDGLWAFYSSVKSGDGLRFIEAIRYLFSDDHDLTQDLASAENVIEERTLRSRDFFNALAGDWEKLKKEILGDFDLGGAILDLVDSRARSSADLGCGTGDFLALLKKRCDRAIGVDNSPEMLDLARRRFSGDGKRVDLRLGELEHLPLVDGEADLAVMNLVLHHLPSPVLGVREAHRAISKGGSFIIADFEKHTDEKLRSSYGDRWLGFSGDDIKDWLVDAGFHLLEMRRFSLAGGLSVCIYKSSRE